MVLQHGGNVQARHSDRNFSATSGAKLGCAEFACADDDDDDVYYYSGKGPKLEWP